MHGDALALVEQLDGAGGDAGLDLLAQQPVRHRIVMTVDIDVVVEGHAADAPFGINERFRRQRRQRRPVQFARTAGGG